MSNNNRYGRWGLSALVALLATFFIGSTGIVANAAYNDYRKAEITAPTENFSDKSGGGGVSEGIYGLDTQLALDKAGDIWVWGYYNLCTPGNAGMGGYYKGSPNGALYTNKGNAICGGAEINNKPAVIRGVSCMRNVAGSAHAVMAADCKGNLYGWGDNTPGGTTLLPPNAAFSAMPGGPRAGRRFVVDPTGGVYGIYKDQTAAPEAIPATVNQSNPNETPQTWKPIDGPDAPRGTYPGGDDTHKVTMVASAEYAFSYLKDDGTVWSVGTNVFGQRGTGHRGGRNLKGYPVGNKSGVAMSPTKVAFPDGVKVVRIVSGYEGFYAIDSNNQVWYWGRSFTGNSGLSNDELRAQSSRHEDKPCKALSDHGSDFYCYAPVQVPSITRTIAENGGLTDMRSGYGYGALLTANKKLWTWGVSTDRIGMPEANGILDDLHFRSTPQVLSAQTNTGSTITADNVVAINAGFKSGQFITEDGTVWGWGNHLWGGAFSADRSATGRNKANHDNRPGIIWDPAEDLPRHRKAVRIGGNKDGANLNLDDGSVYAWGENGGGVSLAGQGYAQKVCASGQAGCVSPKVNGAGGRSQAGLYVWPAQPTPDVQNIGSYQTVTKNAYPFETKPVHKGDTVRYTAVLRNTKSSNDSKVKIADQWGANASLVPGSFSAKYTLSNGQSVEGDSAHDITAKFALGTDGYQSSDANLTLDPSSTLVISYSVKVTAGSGTVGGQIVLSDAASGSVIDSDKTENPIQ